ncbi:competence type IV pilus minor pilin ComGD [Lactobacillaceae bacterium Scapto_B20]
MLKSKTAFTLLESLIVLMITVIIFSLGMVGFNSRSTNHLQLKMFWQAFQRQWKHAEQYAVAYQSNVRVIFLERHLQFIYDEPLQNQRINYPSGLQNANQHDSLLIKAGGHISPKTIYWRWDDSKTIKQTFQLGWGIYRIKE